MPLVPFQHPNYWYKLLLYCYFCSMLKINNIVLYVIYTIILLKSVAVCKLQVAILAQSSRELSQTVRIDWMQILSRVRVSVRPSNFFVRENHQKTVANSESPMRLFTFRPSHAGKCGHGWAAPTSRTGDNCARWRLTWQITQMYATIQNGHNDSLFLHGLKSVV